ncbi:MAG: hypothetical protein FWG53_04315, partial [Clostridiales bacterium]|nr:hypothetical protein [Clostridiales bacterium]
GELDSQLSALSDIARIFDEVQYEALNKALQDFRTQLQVYSTQTGEVTIDTTVWSTAESVVKLFNQYSRQLTEVRDYQEFLLKGSAVPDVNKMLEDLAMLNKNIRECDVFGNPALELRDERNLLLDKLSTYMKIDVTYYPDPDPELAKRGVEICKVAFVCDNDPPLDLDQRTLVDGKNFATLRVEQIPDDEDPNRLTYVTSSGLIDTRTGLPIYTIPGNPGLQFTTGALKGALDMLDSKGAFDDPPNTLNGIGYYQSVLDQIVRDFAETMNNANAYADPAWQPFIPDPAWLGDPAEAPLIANPVPPALMNDHPLFETNDGSLVINAANIQIAEGWKNGSYNLTTSKNMFLSGDDYLGDTSNLLYMISLLDSPFNFTTSGIDDPAGYPLFKGTFEQMFKNTGLIAAQEVSAKTRGLADNTYIIVGIEEMRNSLSSVSMDEEGVNLLRFQKSYAANARVMTTLDEALEVLINKMGVVGR